MGTARGGDVNVPPCAADNFLAGGAQNVLWDIREPEVPASTSSASIPGCRRFNSLLAALPILRNALDS